MDFNFVHHLSVCITLHRKWCGKCPFWSKFDFYMTKELYNTHSGIGIRRMSLNIEGGSEAVFVHHSLIRIVQTDNDLIQRPWININRSGQERFDSLSMDHNWSGLTASARPYPFINWTQSGSHNQLVGSCSSTIISMSHITNRLKKPPFQNKKHSGLIQDIWVW